MSQSVAVVPLQSETPIPTVTLPREQYQRIVVQSLLMERRLLSAAIGGVTFEGKRDLYAAVGYKRQLTFHDYWWRYKRGDIGKRIITLPPDDTWRKPPGVTDIEEDGDRPDTPFEQGWKTLVKRLRVWHHLHRLDRLAGIGRFGVLLIGVRDGKPLDQPLEDGSLKKPEDVLFLAPYTEGSVTVKSVNLDPTNERFNLPEVYTLKLGNNEMGSGTSRDVHWSRLLHVAEDLDEDDVYGTPRLEAVWNRLDDLEKVLASGAEAAWNIADRGLKAKAEKDFRFQDSDYDAIEDQMDEYRHGHRRTFVTNGFDVTPLGGETVDPSPTANKVLEMVSAETGIPQRILTGSERGELASSQDAATWAGVIASRQSNHAEPVILRPFIDRLVRAGALPSPEGGDYRVKWVALFEMTDNEHATLRETRARTYHSYRQDGVAPYEAAIASGHDETMARRLEQASAQEVATPQPPGTEATPPGSEVATNRRPFHRPALGGVAWP